MASKSLSKAIDKANFGVNDEQELISLLFSRPFETLRTMVSCDGHLLKDIIKVIMEEFKIADRTARKHVTSLIKAELFIRWEDGRVYRNEKKIEWLRAYLLSIFPNIEGEHIAEMPFRTTKKLDPKTLEKNNSLLPKNRKGVKLRVFGMKNFKKII